MKTKAKRNSEKYVNRYVANVLQYIESFRELDLDEVYAEYTDNYADQIEGMLEVIDMMSR